MEVERIRRIIVTLIIVACFLWTGTASGATDTYTFDPNQSTVVRSFLDSETYTLSGAFQLTVDANSGSFDWVDATFSDDPNLQTGDLEELFYMDELVGDVVNDTTIEFELSPGHPVRQSYDIHITLTFQNGHVRLTGQRFPLIIVGEPGFTLEAVASLVKVVYVDTDAPGGGDGSSWATAYNYLQDALADANSSTKPVEIRVAQGIHKPDHGMNQHLENQYASFQLQNFVAIKGGYGGIGEPDPNARDIELYETILSGEISDDEDTLHVVCGSGTDKTAVLDGFTITGGCAWSSNNYIGGGMYNYAGSPTVRNCTFFENYAGFYGGGMCNDGNSCPTLINCIFKNNSATDGGGMDNEYSNPILINCTFIGNSACPYNADTYGGAGRGRNVQLQQQPKPHQLPIYRKHRTRLGRCRRDAKQPKQPDADQLHVQRKLG
jgi:hypothetical protein